MCYNWESHRSASKYVDFEEYSTQGATFEIQIMVQHYKYWIKDFTDFILPKLVLIVIVGGKISKLSTFYQKLIIKFYLKKKKVLCTQ